MNPSKDFLNKISRHSVIFYIFAMIIQLDESNEKTIQMGGDCLVDSHCPLHNYMYLAIHTSCPELSGGQGDPICFRSNGHADTHRTTLTFVPA